MTDTSDYHNNLAEVAKAISKCATWLKYLGGGDNGSQVGAVEFLAIKTNEGMESIADAIRGHGADVKEGLETLAIAVDKLSETLGDEIGSIASSIEDLKTK